MNETPFVLGSMWKKLVLLTDTWSIQLSNFFQFPMWFVKDEDLESYESEDEDQDESVAHRLVPFLVESRDGFAVAQKAALQVACGSLNPTETKLVMVTRNPQHVVNMCFAFLIH